MIELVTALFWWVGAALWCFSWARYEVKTKKVRAEIQELIDTMKAESARLLELRRRQ